jgi:cobalt-zinc-cadmium efflux system protein
VAGAFTHILTDLYAFIATAVAGLIIVLTGFARADAVATLIVVLLMLHAGYGLIKDSGRIFLEAAPAGLAPAAVGAAMAARPHVAEVHDLHIWEITSGQPAASAHVLVAPGSDCHAARADLEQFLAGSYGISHATLQVDHAPAPAAAPDTVTGCGENPGVPSQHHCDDAHGPSYRPSGASSALYGSPKIWAAVSPAYARSLRAWIAARACGVRTSCRTWKNRSRARRSARASPSVSAWS